MNTVVKIQPKDVGSIPYQEASFDIWDKKYRLTSKDGSPVDKSMDDTYKRVARALADVEGEQSRSTVVERACKNQLPPRIIFGNLLKVFFAERLAAFGKVRNHVVVESEICHAR